jgi:hypothetical protein
VVHRSAAILVGDSYSAEDSAPQPRVTARAP